MATKTEGSIDFAGDYDLPHVFIHTTLKEGGQRTVIDIKNLMIELNIYESIYKNALTGSIVVIDSQNLIAKLHLQGIERISFKLKTPGLDGKRQFVDASVDTGHPFHIYKITDRKQLSPGTNLYTIHFASREFMRNLRTKVSQAVEGRMHMQALKIFSDPNLLDSRKELTYEAAGNSDKVVIPNMRPFDAINMLASKTLPEKSNGVGYYFYETTKGYHYRSWENMVSSQGTLHRKTKQDFYYMPMNITDPNIEDKIQHDYQSVESYKFVNNIHDVAANTALGTYAHRVITHNLYDKSYNIKDYHYHNSFLETRHTETDLDKSYAVSPNEVDHDRLGRKNVSDYPESRVSLNSTTQFLHDDIEGSGYGLEVSLDGKRLGQGIAQQNQVVQGTALKLVVKGQSYLEAGDLINFKLRSVDEKNIDGVEDPVYSGRYVITKIRHQINATKYRMVLECAKDSMRSSVGLNDLKIEENNNFFTYRETYVDETGIADYD